MRRTVLLVSLTAVSLVAMTGSASAIIYTPTSLVFGAQNVGTQSNPQEVDVGGGSCGPDTFDGMNNVPGPCFPESSDIAVSGPFVITGNSCTPVLFSPTSQSILSCSVAVAYLPTAAGVHKGFLRLQSNPAISGVPLSGKGCVKAKTSVRCVKKSKKKRKKNKKK